MRIGFRDTALIGAADRRRRHPAVRPLGPTPQVWQVAGACFVVGVGLGLPVQPRVVAVQSVVGWDRRGVVTGTNMFSRSIGSAVGAAVFGAIANATLACHFAHAAAALVAGSCRLDATSLVMSGQRGPGARRGHRVRPRGALRRLAHTSSSRLVAVAVLAVVRADADAPAHRAAHLRLSLPAVRLGAHRGTNGVALFRMFPTPVGNPVVHADGRSSRNSCGRGGVGSSSAAPAFRSPTRREGRPDREDHPGEQDSPGGQARRPALTPAPMDPSSWLGSPTRT